MIELKKTLQILKRIFEENQINYALIGGFALAFYNYERFTKDIDFLIHKDQIEIFKRKMLDQNFNIRFENENCSRRSNYWTKDSSL